MSTRKTKQQQQEQQETTSSSNRNWFQKVFRANNQQQNDSNDKDDEQERLLEKFHSCVRTAKHPKQVREAVQLAVELIELRRGEQTAQPQQQPQQLLVERRSLLRQSSARQQEDAFQELVGLFWPLEAAYDETPFYRSAWTSSCEMAKLCFALLVLSSSAATNTYPGFETSQQPVHTLAIQIGLSDFLKVVIADLREAAPHEHFVWPFQAFVRSQYSMMDMAALAMSYLEPYPALLSHAQSIVDSWQEDSFKSRNSKKQRTSSEQDEVVTAMATATTTTAQEECPSTTIDCTVDNCGWDDLRLSTRFPVLETISEEEPLEGTAGADIVPFDDDNDV